MLDILFPHCVNALGEDWEKYGWIGNKAISAHSNWRVA